MLVSTDVAQYEIQQFCLDTLDSSTEFSDYLTNDLGIIDTMTYQVDIDVVEQADLPLAPYAIALCYEEDDDLEDRDYAITYPIHLVFGLQDEKTKTTIGNLRAYQEPITLEKMARKAIEIIQSKLLSTGISGNYNISIIAGSGTRTPTGGSYNIEYDLRLIFASQRDI